MRGGGDNRGLGDWELTVIGPPLNSLLTRQALVPDFQTQPTRSKYRTTSPAQVGPCEFQYFINASALQIQYEFTFNTCAYMPPNF